MYVLRTRSPSPPPSRSLEFPDSDPHAPLTGSTDHASSNLLAREDIRRLQERSLNEPWTVVDGDEDSPFCVTWSVLKSLPSAIPKVTGPVTKRRFRGRSTKSVLAAVLSISGLVWMTACVGGRARPCRALALHGFVYLLPIIYPKYCASRERVGRNRPCSSLQSTIDNIPTYFDKARRRGIFAAIAIIAFIITFVR